MHRNGFLRHGVLPTLAHHNQSLLGFLLKASREPRLLKDFKNHANAIAYARTQAFDLGTINHVYPRNR